jgi:PP-loop superfamily ATP-utilizing enzyme
MNKAWEMKEKLTDICLKSGFNFVTIDLKGYRSGSMNEMLPDSVKQAVLSSGQE